jgi:hypothetical protein|tara:strand:- start:531 stop:1856 length:1326 start_codon:yes stop_codon:yes gene_type:complete
VGILIADIPSHSFEEISYTLNCLLGEFLGLEFEVFKKEITDTVIRSDKGALTINNHFFKEGVEPINFDLSFLPSKVSDDFLDFNGNQFPLLTLYGNRKIDKKGEEIILDSDIIASTFFMLSRWEEFVNPERDAHNRFPAKSSIAFKLGFLDRPVVNEYVELLWSLLETIGCSQERKIRKYKLVPTHDVDRPFLFTSWTQNIRLFGGFIKRLHLTELVDFCKYAISGIDPWDTHDLFMDLSEKANVKSYFFFLPKGKNRHDGRYDLNDPKVKLLYKKIRERGHHIGYHPSYNAYNDIDLFRKEKKELENAIDSKVEFGRQHYLRFAAPVTWQIWDKCEMNWDSTMSYADCSGFRCGVCYPFPVFDIEKRKQLNLLERPLVVMEGSLIGYEKLSLEDAKIKVDRLKDQVKKYNGEFIFLYHNSSFFEGKYRTVGIKLLHALYN